MFAELRQVFDILKTDPQLTPTGLFADNILGKKTKYNQDKTTELLRRLYVFDEAFLPYRALRFFWQLASEPDQRLLMLLFALGREPLLAESADVVLNTPEGETVAVARLDVNIEKMHPSRYQAGTRLETARRLASSWRQAGYLAPGISNKRLRTQPGYLAVAFALLLAWLNGDRGEFMLRSRWVKALDSSPAILRERASEAAQRGLLRFQMGGDIISFSFAPLWPQLEVNPADVEN